MTRRLPTQLFCFYYIFSFSYNTMSNNRVWFFAAHIFSENEKYSRNYVSMVPRVNDFRLIYTARGIRRDTAAKSVFGWKKYNVGSI